jgi:hypothetical protein
VRFPNLYPRQESQTFVIPRSARSCKRFHGFVDEDRPVAVRGHGVFDTLLYAPEDFRCTKRQGRQACGAPMEPIYGFYASESGAVSGAQQVQPARRSLTRTAIEYATDTARSGRLYTLEAMEEGGGGLPFFAGIVEATPPTTLASETHKDIVLHLLWEHLTSEAYTLTVGTAKTRGLGKIRLEFPAFARARPSHPWKSASTICSASGVKFARQMRRRQSSL